MQYKVKTAFGTSDANYTSTTAEPLFGTGQGSGASPAVWLTLVVVLMNTLDRITRDRIRFRSPDAPDHHTRLTDAFVDDTSLAITDTYNPMTPNEMIRSIETIAKSHTTNPKKQPPSKSLSAVDSQQSSRVFPYLRVELFYSKAQEIPYSKAVPTIGKASQLYNQPQAATTKQVIISSGFTAVQQSVSVFARRVILFESTRDSVFKSGANHWEGITAPQPTPSSNHQASHHQQWILSSPAEHFLISVLNYPIQQQRSSTINIVLGHHSLIV
jgi:hypothetical protein